MNEELRKDIKDFLTEQIRLYRVFEKRLDKKLKEDLEKKEDE